MSDSIIKIFSAIILAVVVLINTIGNTIGIGDIIPTQPEEEPTTVVDTTEFDEEEAAEFLAFLNAETAKIVADGSYKMTRKADYTKPIDVGGAADVINAIITAIDDNWSLEQAVAYFLGVGTETAEYPEDYIREDYQLKATNLRASDLAAFSEEDGVFKFTIKDATNPKKNGVTGFSNFTNDFVTEEEVIEEISRMTNAITVEDSTAEYTNINVEVTVEDGKITNISYSHDLDAEITVKAGIAITGIGSIRTESTYSDIEY